MAQRHVFPLGVVILLFLAGCGSNMGSGGTPPPIGSATPPSIVPVILQVGAASYQAGSTISVTIKNQSTQAISFADHQTNCSVLQLERHAGTSWEQVAPCKLMIATRLHTLKAGEVLNVTLTAPGQWPKGTYRARLDFWFGSGTGSGAPTTVSSSGFRVG